MHDERRYYLVIRVGKNSFTPIDWTETSYYEGENLYTLSGIDKFTSKVLSLDLIKECLRLNLIDANDLFSSLEILYIENGKNYTVKEGPIFLEDSHIMSEDTLINYIIQNKDNKEAINNFVMQCNLKNSSQELEDFKLILKNIGKLNVSDRLLQEYLSVFKDFTYEQKRSICYRISDRIYNSKQNKNTKGKKLQDQRKVA